MSLGKGVVALTVAALLVVPAGRTITGEDFRRDWNLPSTLFTLTSVD